MPFVSDKQRRYLYSQKPEVAKKFAEHSPDHMAKKRALKKLGEKNGPDHKRSADKR